MPSKSCSLPWSSAVSTTTASVSGWVHLRGAFLAFFGGHLTAIGIGFCLFTGRRSHLVGNRRLIGVLSIVIGILGIIGIVMLQVDVRLIPGTVLADGILERMGMYAIVVWEVLFGTVLLSRLRQLPLSKTGTIVLD